MLRIPFLRLYEIVTVRDNDDLKTIETRYRASSKVTQDSSCMRCRELRRRWTIYVTVAGPYHRQLAIVVLILDI